MELAFKDGKACLLCRGPKRAHDGGDYNDSDCVKKLEKLQEFLEGYREGLGDRWNFRFAVVVEDQRIVALGSPGRALGNRAAPRKNKAVRTH